MGRLDRYIFSTAATAFVGVTLVLTAMIWSTQALRQLDLVTSQGQTILSFLAITGLTVPTLVLVIAPAALFIATAYTLLKLNGDSEIVVMASAGMSPWRVLRPMILLALLVSAFCAALSVDLVPASLRMFREKVTKVGADVVSFVAQPGRFVTVTDGLVFHVRDRDNTGLMRGVFINDSREKEISTYVADHGRIVDTPSGTFLVLEDGSIHRRTPGASGNGSVVDFERYALGLNDLAPGKQDNDFRPNERPFTYVLDPPPSDVYVLLKQTGRFREEVHKRLSAGLYPFAFFAVAASALASPRTTRQSRSMALVAIIPIMVGLQIASFVVGGMLRTSSAAIPFAYLLPLACIFVCGLVIQGWVRFSAPQGLTRLMEAVSRRLARMNAE